MQIVSHITLEFEHMRKKLLATCTNSFLLTCCSSPYVETRQLTWQSSCPRLGQTDTSEGCDSLFNMHSLNDTSEASKLHETSETSKPMKTVTRGELYFN